MEHFIVWSANDDSEAVCDCGVHMRAVTVGAGGMPSAQRMQNRTLGEVIAEHFIRSKPERHQAPAIGVKPTNIQP